MESQPLTSLRHEFADWEEAQEYYAEANLTDGLPIVPPDEDRVRAMLEFVRLPPNQVIGVEAIRKRTSQQRRWPSTRSWPAAAPNISQL